MGQQLSEALADALNVPVPAAEPEQVKEPYPFKKLYENGKVAVIYAASYGCGWWSRNKKHEGLLFDSDIAQAVLAEDFHRVRWLALSRYPDAYLSSAEELSVRWVPIGAKFEVREYDGSESVSLLDERNWLTA